MVTRAAGALGASWRIGLMLMVLAGLAGAAQAADGAVPPTATSPASRPSAAELGTNLSGLADWSSELPFVDEFRQARGWISQKKDAGWGKGPALHLDSHGWVTQLDPDCWAETLMFTGLHGHYPAGRYTVVYSGKGEVTLDGPACKVITREPGRIIVEVAPALGGMFLQIRQTDPADYVRDIHVIMPGFDKTYATQIFRPGFLNRWRGMRCFRFVHWMMADEKRITISSWSERPRMDDATWTRRGVPLSVMIALCNQEHADAWFCLPHQADDDYVRRFAMQVKAQLDPSLKAYIEYSNEVWNGGYAQHGYALRQGQQLHLGRADRPWEGACLYYVRRSLEIFKIWQDVFGEQAKTRLVRVLAWQAASATYWLDGELLSHTQPGQVDALAIAPYITFNVKPDQAKTVEQWSVQQLLDRVSAQSLPECEGWIRRAAGVAAKYHVELVAYEAGQSLLGIRGAQDDKALTDLFERANAAPAMGEIYTRYLNFWQSQGGGLLNNFSSMGRWSKWGCWGLLQYYDDDPGASPKFMAVMRWGRSLGQNVTTAASAHTGTAAQK